MTGYMIASIEVHDPKRFDEYRQKVEPLIAQYGGRYIVRGGEVRNLEGALPLKRLVVLEFPSVEAAQRFYDSPEYKPVLGIRLESAKSDVLIVPGFTP